ncbi:MAG TPA: winged helix DNA-binding domain-containing protein [Longimicrobium sp.]|nr:winged helix DNA-binding domain-containing protein [Longimicrobium sp.]
MHPHDIAHRRMHAQRLAGNPLGAPRDVVGWLGCVQSQDYGPAKWSVGERTRGATDTALDEAFAAGAILRTHVLRPTWHFVLPADIRWIQGLTAARVHAQNAYYYRQTGLEDAGTRDRARRLITDALRGGSHLTRKQLESVLLAGGIAVKGLGTAYVLMDAELDCVVVSGPLKGKQQTYALFDERVPDAPVLSRGEALGELAARYFTSRGPATAKDMRFWSSLTLADIQRGIEIAGPRLRREEIDGLTFWSAPGEAPPEVPSPTVHLLQGLDEYFVGYGESRGYCDHARTRPSLVDRAIYNGALILDSQLAGHWKRTVTKRAVTFTVALSILFDDAQTAALQATADAYGAFLGLSAVVEAAPL